MALRHQEIAAATARAEPIARLAPRGQSRRAMGDAHSGGISKLLAAESEAQEVVNKARKGTRPSLLAPAGQCPPAARQLQGDCDGGGREQHH